MLDSILDKIDGIVWGIPTIVLIIITGLILTIRTKGIQFTKTGRAFKQIFIKNEGDGELSGFSALCTALSATIGTGNIVGVATAIASGGPGALFWMWIAAILGTATKFAECMLAIKYREVKEDGHVLGGPFYTIEKGMGSKWKWLAILFAIFGVLAGLLGIGTMTQINGITSAVNMAFDPSSSHIAFTIGETNYTWATVIGGAVVTLFAALVIIGGLKRISKVAEKVVPAMAFIYVFLGLSVLIMNATRIPAAFALIFKSAFGFKAVAGGAIGWTVKQITESMQKGIARGIFSNEAGLGSSVMVHSSSNVREPVVQGMWGIFEVFADTIIVCTITAFTVLSSGLVDLETGAVISDQVSTALVAEAFSTVFGKFGYAFIAIAILLFAFSTTLGWSQYGSKGFEYLFGRKNVKIYQVIFVAFIVVGATMDLSLAWDISDTLNGMMAIPNLIGVLALSGTVMKITQNYVQRKILHKDVKPMLSALDHIQTVHEEEIKKMAV